MVLGDDLLGLSLGLGCYDVKGWVTDYVVFALKGEDGMVVFENALGGLEVGRCTRGRAGLCWLRLDGDLPGAELA